MSLPPPRRRLCDHVVTSTKAEVMRSCRYLHQGGGYAIMSLPPPRRRLCDHVVTSTKAEVMRSMLLVRHWIISLPKTKTKA